MGTTETECELMNRTSVHDAENDFVVERRGRTVHQKVAIFVVKTQKLQTPSNVTRTVESFNISQLDANLYISVFGAAVSYQ